MLRELIPELEAEGYEVYVHPNRPVTPAFLGNFQPDAVALRSDKNLLIEVISQTSHAEEKIKQLSELVAAQPNWQLRVVWVTPTSKHDTLQTQTPNSISKRIAEVRDLISAEHNAAALLSLGRHLKL